MDAQLLGTATAFGLAGAVGLNTTLPLLLVGLLARFGLVELNPPYDALAAPLTLVGLATLAIVEFVADKVPALDTVVHLVQWPAAAVAGAILFGSQTSVIRSVSPELAILAGVVTAGAMHGVRTAARPVVTTVTGGLGNPAISATEDVAAATLAGTAVFLPILAAVLLVLLMALFVLVGVRAARGAQRWSRARGRR